MPASSPLASMRARVARYHVGAGTLREDGARARHGRGRVEGGGRRCRHARRSRGGVRQEQLELDVEHEEEEGAAVGAQHAVAVRAWVRARCRRYRAAACDARGARVGNAAQLISQLYLSLYLSPISRLSHGYLTSISRLSHLYLTSIFSLISGGSPPSGAKPPPRLPSLRQYRLRRGQAPPLGRHCSGRRGMHNAEASHQLAD